jgi:hypothetical protein
MQRCAFLALLCVSSSFHLASLLESNVVVKVCMLSIED